jgi:hypothetical protein
MRVEKDIHDHRDGWALPSHIGEARGVYNPMQFVVRLHDEVHAELEDVPPGVAIRTVTGRQALAHATYFHERIHWWQHVGSTYGLVMSLSYPAQTHVNYTRLRDLLRSIGPVKSLRTFNRLRGDGLKPGVREELNIVLNNWHDIEYCRWLSLVPQLIQEAVKDPYFESIGHAYNVTWGNVVLLISDSIDPARTVLPDPYEWEVNFAKLREDKTEDYFYGSRVQLSTIGARLIFEGQARFSQLQSLYFSRPKQADWNLFASLGMLNDDYTAAFRAFLAAVNRPWPATPADPEVAAFLAICDVAMNPSEGFPFAIEDFSRLRMNLDPGIRFVKLCRALAASPELLDLVCDYSRPEYEEFVESLARSLNWISPIGIAERVGTWSGHDPVGMLLEEDAQFRFKNTDLPVRVFLGRFFEFQRDKFLYPQLLVWPGAFATDAKRDVETSVVIEVLERQAPLFVDVAGGEVRPSLLPGRAPTAVYDTFNAFHTYSASYQLVRQWHVIDGPFDPDFAWLTPTSEAAVMAAWAERIFSDAFGVSTAAFEILDPAA